MNTKLYPGFSADTYFDSHPDGLSTLMVGAGRDCKTYCTAGLLVHPD